MWGKRYRAQLCHKSGREIAECHVERSGQPGIIVAGGADPLVRRCVISDGQASGVLVQEKGRGRFEACEVTANGNAGVAVRSGGAPKLAGCRVARNGYYGVWIVDAESGGEFEDVTFNDNAAGDWRVADGVSEERISC